MTRLRRRARRSGFASPAPSPVRAMTARVLDVVAAISEAGGATPWRTAFSSASAKARTDGKRASGRLASARWSVASVAGDKDDRWVLTAGASS